MKIRIKFAKYGAMKFIGHLDMMRFFQKAIRRAGIDVKYSEGFSPHQIMSFAAPLGVGLESFGEYLDIEVNSMTTANEMKAALNQVMVEGVEVLSVGVLPDTVKNAMASVAAASYRLHSKEGDFEIPDLEETVRAFYAQESIPYTKETKKSVIELDLKQGIYEIAVEESSIRMLVNASSSGNIKPSMVFEKLCEFAGVEIPASAYQVTRLETYTDLAQEGEAHHFVPLAACCQSPKPECDCSVCARIRMIQEKRNPYFVRELQTGYVVLGDSQRFEGYTLFLCKEHATELHFLEPVFRNQFLQEMSLVAEAVYNAFQPDKINYELLGVGNAVHMHWHIFPRRKGDTPIQGPVWWLGKEEMNAEQYKPDEEKLEGLKHRLNTELNKLSGV